MFGRYRQSTPERGDRLIESREAELLDAEIVPGISVLRVQFHGRAEGARGLLPPVEVGVGDSEHVEIRGRRGLLFGQRVKVSERAVIALEGDLDTTEREDGIGVELTFGLLERERLLKRGERLFVLLELIVSQPNVLPTVCVIGVLGSHLLELGDGGAELPLFVKRDGLLPIESGSRRGD
jgi:hypothetical protein